VVEGAGEPGRHACGADAFQRLLDTDEAPSGSVEAFFFRPEGVSGEEIHRPIPAYFPQERLEARNHYREPTKLAFPRG
jgi:hypothetical protein